MKEQINYTALVKIELQLRNMTVTQLAKKIGYARETISREINQKTQSKKLRKKINNYLNIKEKQ